MEPQTNCNSHLITYPTLKEKGTVKAKVTPLHDNAYKHFLVTRTTVSNMNQVYAGYDLDNARGDKNVVFFS